MLLAAVAIGILGWLHGRDMYRIGVSAGRLELQRERLEREAVAERCHLRVVK